MFGTCPLHTLRLWADVGQAARSKMLVIFPKEAGPSEFCLHLQWHLVRSTYFFAKGCPFLPWPKSLTKDKFKSQSEGVVPNRIMIWQFQPPKSVLTIAEQLPMKATKEAWQIICSICSSSCELNAIGCVEKPLKQGEVGCFWWDFGYLTASSTWHPRFCVHWSVEMFFPSAQSGLHFWGGHRHHLGDRERQPVKTYPGPSDGHHQSLSCRVQVWDGLNLGLPLAPQDHTVHITCQYIYHISKYIKQINIPDAFHSLNVLESDLVVTGGNSSQAWTLRRTECWWRPAARLEWIAT